MLCSFIREIFEILSYHSCVSGAFGIMNGKKILQKYQTPGFSLNESYLLALFFVDFGLCFAFRVFSTLFCTISLTKPLLLNHMFC